MQDMFFWYKQSERGDSMHRKFKKIAATVLAAAMALQSCAVTGIAEEQTEAQTQAATEQETQPQTQAVTEKETQPQTQAATEQETQPQTQAATEQETQPQTQAATEQETQPATEKETQPVTEKETQPGTEKETQPGTEKETQPGTEKETQPGTENETQPGTEKETQPGTETEDEETETSSETETETERSERKNDGEKIKTAVLKQGLQAVLPYLFAGSQVTISEDLAEEQEIVSGEEGKKALTGLDQLSLRLADGQSTSEVQVINVYAEKDGTLDAAQIEEVFQKETIDVSNAYVVVNVIADQKEQKLNFSGYELVRNGQSVQYTEEEQPGEILYNFAWLDGDKFAAFEGTVELTSVAVIQGTFLAPKADVKLNSAFAGAVYAENITAADSISELKRIVFIEGAEKEESESETESETENKSEPEDKSEPETASEPENKSEPETAAEPENKTEPETAAEPENKTEPETASEPENKTEPETAAEPENKTEPETAAETENKSEPESSVVIEDISEVETETEASESETNPEMETETETDLELLVLEDFAKGAPSVIDLMPASQKIEKGVELQIRLFDASDAKKASLAGAEAVICAADSICDQMGNEVLKKDEEAAEIKWQEAVAAEAILYYSGTYYLDLTKVPTAKSGISQYVLPPRIYFTVDEAGKILFETDQKWFSWNKQQLSIGLTRTEEAQVIVRLTGQKEDGKSDGILLSGGTFVLKDENGTILRDKNGNPSYYICAEGQEVSLNGLKPGTYQLSQIQAPQGYQPAADRKFVIDDAASPVKLIVSNAKTADDAVTLELTASAVMNGTALTSETEQVFYAALFQDKALKKKVSNLAAMSYSKEASTTAKAELTTEEGTYYLAATDEFGEPIGTDVLQISKAGGKTEKNGAYLTLKIKKAAGSKQTAALNYCYQEYPTNLFSYEAEISLTKLVKDPAGKESKVTEDFYAMLYADPKHEEPVLETPEKLELKEASSTETAVKVKLTEDQVSLWLAETDKTGALITEEFGYAITYPGHADGKLTISCGVKTEAQIQNQKNNSIVKIRVEDADGKLLSGAKLVLKNQKTGEVVPVKEQSAVFTFDGEELILENQLETGITYVLTELTAPEGYQNTSDAVFTAEDGKTAEAVLKNEPKQSGESLTVLKQVFCGEDQVYAQDLESGTYEKEGCYTFYAALYADSERTRKVSDVQEINITKLNGTTVFDGLKKGSVYYVAETDEYGTVVKDSDSCTIKYAGGGKIQMTEGGVTAEIQNIYAELPRGYRYTATLTITKKLQNSDGEAEAASKTFYAGIYRTADYSDTPTIIPITLNYSSEGYERRRILLPGTDDLTYYIAEVNEQGERITADSEFGYNVTIDQPQVTIRKGENASVTITNRAKISHVTLYVTKKVYKGTSQQAVNETFYAGLFKDPEFTELYTDPIPLELKGKSELTLKLTLSLGSAAGTKIYVAEVDKDGNVIKNCKEFGYDIRIVNAAAVFTQERTEVQSIILNAVYNSVDDDDWEIILGKDDNGIWDDFGGAPSTNGGGGYGGDVATGDETPILPYVLALLLAGFVLLNLSRQKNRTK